MRNIWVISDTHFNHANILSFTDKNGNLIRPGFDSVDHMNEHMIEKWNSQVKDGDIIYHLGDVFIGDKEKFQQLWPRLNGKKRLVVGNHDDIKYMVNGKFFSKISMWRTFKEFGLLLTHVPVDINSIIRVGEGGKNVHGHLHQNQSPTKHHINVSVEQINYTPVNIDSIRAW